MRRWAVLGSATFDRRRRRSLRRPTAIVAGTALLLAIGTPAGAELTVQGWLNLYDGKTETPPVVARLMATSYAFGIADGIIALRLFSCPPGYIPKAEDIGKHTAMVLRDSLKDPGASVTGAVLIALSIDGPCSEGPNHPRRR